MLLEKKDSVRKEKKILHSQIKKLEVHVNTIEKAVEFSAKQMGIKNNKNRVLCSCIEKRQN